MRRTVLVVLLLSPSAWADEGMWTFHDFPAELVKDKYGEQVTPEWLDHVRRATVRLSRCTASFISPSGLILTNHHCVTGCLAEHSSCEKSLPEQGFIARSRAAELRCAAQIADVLVESEEITPKVAAAVAGLDEEAANEARKRTLTQLEQACEQSTARSSTAQPLKCESVNLYDGGQYFLYKYRRYSDVRMVFAPEEDIAAFGGDPDNFQFPRWSLDMALLRAYEGNAPAKSPGHLSVRFDGPRPGELVFVAGNPGSTDRLLMLSELMTLQDVEPPQ